ncbi:MAG: hypothetical protein R3E64_07835 [Halioglobus sp.]
MGQFLRAGHMDVSNTVDVSNPESVAVAVTEILQNRYPSADLWPVAVLFRDFARLYRGQYPGYRACDVPYHDTQHVLDVTLAMARLLDGYECTSAEKDRLGPQMAMIGIAAALFHDSGYIRRTRDNRNQNGAAYTRVHVSRGIRFITGYLPQVGLLYMVDPCTRILHFTGHEVDPSALPVANEQEHLLGKLLGTADLIAQMSDVAYIQKCRDFLFEEFTEGGLAGDTSDGNHKRTLYQSPDQLLRQTPHFMRTAIGVRLDGHFNSVHRYAANYFNGRHLYMDAIEKNCLSLEAMLAVGGI